VKAGTTKVRRGAFRLSLLPFQSKWVVGGGGRRRQREIDLEEMRRGKEAWLEPGRGTGKEAWLELGRGAEVHSLEGKKAWRAARGAIVVT
jgi:hypothetical protein